MIRLTWRQRGLALVGGLGALGIIALARLLPPDPRGVGTHERLGLPPCLSEALFHVPCPFCGMTTAFSLMAHGRIQEAFGCQPAGALAFVGVVLTLGGASAGAATGRWVPIRMSETQSRFTWAVVLSVIVLAWVYKVLTFCL